MTTYNTMNPVPSSDARDRYDNSENLDNFSNGPLDAYPDRFGVSRQSLQGIRNASQYVDLGPYAAGLVFTSRNQVFSYNPGTGAEFYSPGPAITLPYTTTGAGAGEIANFRSVGDAILRSDLADSADPEEGAALVGYKGRTVAQRLSDTVSIKDFGATGDGVTDDTAAILSAVAALSNPSRNVLYFPYGSYRTSATIEVPPGANTWCAPGVVFQRFGAAPKNFPCFVVNGGGREHYIGLIDAYGDGIVVRGSTNRVRFQRISNCTRGLVISAISASNLDNKIDGVQIGLSTDAIVFEQSGKRTQQGNEIRVNFVSESLNTLVFDDLGTHTEQSSWDSNLVELMASDPFYKVGATLCLNKSGFSVPALNYAIKSWAGGWNVGDGTITVIKGPFSGCIFNFSFAAPLSAGDLVASGTSRSASDSCQFVIPRTSNLGSGAAIGAVAIGTTFNGGVDLVHKRFRLACTFPSLAAGQTTRVAFRHILAQTNFGGRFKIVGVETGGVPLIFNIRNSGTESHGWASVWAYNPAATTVAGATYNIIIEAGD